MDEWREEQGHLRRQLQEESDMRTGEVVGVMRLVLYTMSRFRDLLTVDSANPKNVSYMFLHPEFSGQLGTSQHVFLVC